MVKRIGKSMAFLVVGAMLLFGIQSIFTPKWSGDGATNRFHEKKSLKQRKRTFFAEKSKKICVFGKKVVPLHDFSRGVGSKEPICCVMSREAGWNIGDAG